MVIKVEDELELVDDPVPELADDPVLLVEPEPVLDEPVEPAPALDELEPEPAPADDPDASSSRSMRPMWTPKLLSPSLRRSRRPNRSPQ